eukprot:Rmarinus@m.9386
MYGRIKEDGGVPIFFIPPTLFGGKQVPSPSLWALIPESRLMKRPRTSGISSSDSSQQTSQHSTGSGTPVQAHDTSSLGRDTHQEPNDDGSQLPSPHHLATPPAPARVPTPPPAESLPARVPTPPPFESLPTRVPTPPPLDSLPASMAPGSVEPRGTFPGFAPPQPFYIPTPEQTGAKSVYFSVAASDPGQSDGQDLVSSDAPMASTETSDQGRAISAVPDCEDAQATKEKKRIVPRKANAGKSKPLSPIELSRSTSKRAAPSDTGRCHSDTRKSKKRNISTLSPRPATTSRSTSSRHSLRSEAAPVGPFSPITGKMSSVMMKFGETDRGKIMDILNEVEDTRAGFVERLQKPIAELSSFVSVLSTKSADPDEADQAASILASMERLVMDVCEYSFQSSNFPYQRDDPSDRVKEEGGELADGARQQRRTRAMQRRMPSDEYDKCKKILDMLISKKDASGFMRPTLDLWPDLESRGYLSVVLHPMDLGTISRRLKDGIYRSERSVRRDILQTFDNALAWNVLGDPWYLKALRLKSLFCFKMGLPAPAMGPIEPSERNFEDCSICGHAGELDLLCCDRCPQSFHLICINKQSMPGEDYWYCAECKKELPPNPPAPEWTKYKCQQQSSHEDLPDSTDDHPQ